ncbi:MAG: CerR family C-terminal domain-containing protein [Candidatus Hydrogenedentales bacterium]
MLSPKNGRSTKERIIEAACKVFAEKGYRDATHAEICQCALANVASINYHFVSKENLYRVVFEHLSQRVQQLYPLDGALPPSASSEEKLRAYIQAHLSRMFDPENLGDLYQIRWSEIFDSTGLLEDLLLTVIEKDRKIIQSILKEFLGSEAPEKELAWCEMSITGQCVLATPGNKNSIPRRIFKLDKSSVADLTDHILAFSLAGIETVRQKITGQAGRSESDDG